MNGLKKLLLQIPDPEDYFNGKGRYPLPTPLNILMFARRHKRNLQQEAIQNRSHHRFVLTLNLETFGYVHVNNLVLPFRPGQALLIHPFQFHHFSHLQSPTLTWLFCTFELEPRTFLEPLRNRVIDIRPQTLKAYRNLTGDWLHTKNELQAEQFQTGLLSLLLALKQDRQQTAGDLPPEPKDNLLRTINRLMSEWSGKPLVVADLAAAMGYSESRLRILFKETAGIPLGAYIRNYRMNRAMALLKTTDLSIAQVAEEAGFGSPQALSRVFKKETGKSPRSYRQNIPLKNF